MLEVIQSASLSLAVLLASALALMVLITRLRVGSLSPNRDFKKERGFIKFYFNLNQYQYL